MLAAVAAAGLAGSFIPTAAVGGTDKDDGRTRMEHSVTLTERNRKVVSEFANLFYVQRDVPRAFGTHVAEDYIQHNPGAADGRAAAIALLTPMFSHPGARFEIKRILVDGEYAVIHVHGIPVAGTAGVAVFDMYRLEGGKIVEHWDAVQPVPPKAANSHPMF